MENLVRFHRRVNIRWTQRTEEEDEFTTGDIIAPDPTVASALVEALILDWAVTEITITAENSTTEEDAETT